MTSMNAESARALLLLSRFLEQHQGRIIIDADTHATDTSALRGELRERFERTSGYYHGRPVSAEDLLAEMEMAGVDMALIWQNPAATDYTADEDRNAETLLAANRYIRDAAARYPERFIPAGWTDPQACGERNALRIVETCVWDYGFPIVKMNPAQNRFPIDGPVVGRIVDRIVELGAVPAFHFGADTPYTPAEGLEAVALRHPEHPVLAVHMGGGGAGYEEAEELYQKARGLGLRRPNLRFILSAKRDTHMESDIIAYQLAGPPFSAHLFCGSDAPYGRMSWNFGGFRAMLASLRSPRHPDPRVRAHPELFRDGFEQAYLGGSFARFVAEACRRVLSVQGVAEAA
jgi:predicted TIM-barrel fold metal-dependent hydrolase